MDSFTHILMFVWACPFQGKSIGWSNMKKAVACLNRYRLEAYSMRTVYPIAI